MEMLVAVTIVICVYTAVGGVIFTQAVLYLQK